MPSMSPAPASLTVRWVCGQRRTWPPRVSFNEAGATPAASSEPDATLIPVPAGWATVGAPGTVANNSPTGVPDPEDCPQTVHVSNSNSAALAIIVPRALFTGIGSFSAADVRNPSARSRDETARLPPGSDGAGDP